MTHRENNLVLVISAGDRPVLSPMQKKFNQLIKKIDQYRNKLKKYQQSNEFYLKEQQRVYWPLFDEFNGYREKLVYLLDGAYAQKDFNQTEKKKIRNIVLSVCAELLSDKANPLLEEVYKKHTDSQGEKNNHPEKEAEEMSEIREMVEKFFNVRLDDSVDFSSPDAVKAAVDEALLQKAQAQENAQAQEEIESFTSKSAKNDPEKMTKKQLEMQEEEKNISHSIREIYRKLASSLHPDREQDLVERERKTELMQRVNTAYANKDLLLLLELQLEIEQIDQKSMARFSEEKLSRYNKILGEQAKELQNEIRDIEFRLKRMFHVPKHGKLKPDMLTEVLVYEVNELHEKIRILQKDIVDFSNAKKLKKMLRSYPLSEEDEEGFEIDLFDLGNMFKF